MPTLPSPGTARNLVREKVGTESNRQPPIRRMTGFPERTGLERGDTIAGRRVGAVDCAGVPTDGSPAKVTQAVQERNPQLTAEVTL